MTCLRRRRVLPLLLWWSAVAADIVQDSCSPSTDNSSLISSLRFTKDLTTYDFAAVGGYKALSCCVEGHTSISWLRGSTPLEVSSTTFHAAVDGQVVVSKFVRAGDEGEFTCVARNSTHSIRHSVHLHVLLNQQYNGPPLPAFRPVDQWAQIGESATFRCSAFIGFGKQRQRMSEMYWQRVGQNFDFAEVDGHSTATVFNYSPDGAIRSSYFHILQVESSDFGGYLCVVNNGHNESLVMHVTLRQGVDPSARTRVSYTAGLALLAAAVLSTALLATAYFSRRTEIHLFFKDRFYALEQQGTHDVFVCYCGQDGAQLVHSSLLTHLEDKLGYSCFVYERDMNAGEWMPDTFSRKVRDSRRFLLLLTPGVTRDAMCRFACQIAVQEALGPRALRLLCVWPPAPQRQLLLEEAENSEALRLMLTVCKQLTLPSEEASSKQLNLFWSELRLQLPPRRPEPRDAETYRPLNTTSV